MNLGKKKRSGNLLMTAASLTAVVAVTVAGQVTPLRWMFAPPQSGELLARFQSEPQDGEAILDALPSDRRSISLLLQLLATPEAKLAKAARREILVRLDELLAGQAADRHDALAVCVATELEQQARQATLPLGAIDDLVARLLRHPPADASQRATLTARCAQALRITAEKHRAHRGACRITRPAPSRCSAAGKVRHARSLSASFPT